MILGWALLLNSPKWFEWTTVEKSSLPLEQESENFGQELKEASERSEASLVENNTLNLEDKIQSTFDMTTSPGREIDSAKQVLF